MTRSLIRMAEAAPVLTFVVFVLSPEIWQLATVCVLMGVIGTWSERMGA